MIFGKTKLELKVGTFVFVGVVILVIFILLIGDFKTWTARYPVNFVFNFVSGVKVGAPVRFAGVDVGEVRNIKFISDPAEKKLKVQITAWIKRQVKVPIDSTVWVNTLGLLGEKYIEIMPGINYDKSLARNEVLVGTDPIAMHEVTQIAKSIAEELKETIVKIREGQGTIGRLLSDDTVYKELEALVTDLRKHPWKIFWKTKEKKPRKKTR